MNRRLSRLEVAAGLALGILILPPTSPSSAQMSPEMKSQARSLLQPCLPDYHKFCSTIEKGNGRVLQCLLDHKAELSDACKTGLVSAKALTNKQSPAQ